MGARELSTAPLRTPSRLTAPSMPAFTSQVISDWKPTLEYRFNIFWVVNGALFLDAGNIWTFRRDTASVDLSSCSGQAVQLYG